MARVLRHAWAVFATLVVADVLLCAAWWLGIGVAPWLANNPLADLAPVTVAWALLPVLAVAALGAGLARGVVRPDAEPGDSLRIDVLARPAVAAAVVGVAGVLFGLAHDGGPDELAVAFAFLFVVCLVGLALVALVVRWTPLRALTAVAVVVVGLALVALGVADRRGRGRLEAHRDQALREVATLRQEQESAVRPVLHDPGVDADAGESYRALARSQRARLDAEKDVHSLMGEISRAVRAPGEPLPTAVAQALDQARADIAKLGEATSSRRATWPVEYEKSFRAPEPDLVAMRALTLLAVLEGHERASAGDAAGAAERYLEVVRFGSDLGGGTLMMSQFGALLEKMATEALAKLVRSPRGAPALDAVDAGLGRLEPGLVRIGPAWRSERLLFAAMGPVDDPAEFSEFVAGSGVVMPNVVTRLPAWNVEAAAAIDVTNRMYGDLEKASGDPQALQSILGEFFPRYYFGTPNFLFRATVPGVLRSWLSVEEARLLVGAVRVAVGLERRLAADGRYPADPGPLPADLLTTAGEPLRYRATADGASYVLYSVGQDQSDDGGKPDRDTVLPEAGWPGASAPPGAAKGASK